MLFLMTNLLQFQGCIRISKLVFFFFFGFFLCVRRVCFRYNGWGVSLIDSLDTMWIMGLRGEFDDALEYVASMNFTIPSVRSISSTYFLGSKVIWDTEKIRSFFRDDHSVPGRALISPRTLWFDHSAFKSGRFGAKASSGV